MTKQPGATKVACLTQRVTHRASHGIQPGTPRARLLDTSHITRITRNEGTLGKLDRYCAKHEHPFTLSYPNGKGKIEFLFYEGYVTIRSRQPGTANQEIHIHRKRWMKILWYAMRDLKKVTKLMEGPSFDRFAAERRYYRAEERHLQELRAQKAERRGPRRRRRRA